MSMWSLWAYLHYIPLPGHPGSHLKSSILLGTSAGALGSPLKGLRVPLRGLGVPCESILGRLRVCLARGPADL